MITILPGNAAYDELNAQPMVAYRNLLAEGTITDALLPAGAPRADAVTQDTSEFWAPTAAATLRATLGSAAPASVCFIAGHTLGSNGRKLSLQRQAASRTNEVLWSEDFSNAAWTKTNVTVTADAVVAPDGSLTADQLVENTATAVHLTSQVPGATPADSATVTLSVYVKAAGRDFFWLETRTKAVTFPNAYFNLATGVVAATFNGASATITPAGDGWYRCTLTADVLTGAGSPQFTCGLAVAATFAGRTYLGDGSSGVYLWGAQYEVGGAATSYIPTTSAAVASDWHEITSHAPTNDDPFAIIFPEESRTGFGIGVSGACQIAIAWIGPRLVIPGGVVPDYVPIWAAKRIEKFPAETRRGHFRGQRIERAGASLSAQFMPVSHTFALTTMADFRDHYNEGNAFIWAPAPAVFPRDVAYCWGDQDRTLDMSIRQGGDLVNLSMQMEAFVER